MLQVWLGPGLGDVIRCEESLELRFCLPTTFLRTCKLQNVGLGRKKNIEPNHSLWRSSLENLC